MKPKIQSDLARSLDAVRGRKPLAIVFDLIGTLTDGPSRLDFERQIERMARTLGVDAADFHTGWIRTANARHTGAFRCVEDNCAAICAELGVRAEPASLTSAAAIRIETMRRCLEPRREAISTLTHLRRGGLQLAIISDCSAEVPALFRETELVHAVDTALFSCSVGVKKPDHRIYSLALSALAVDPQHCIYVGDGGSDELAGASRVGMCSVLLRDPETYEEGHRLGAAAWDGPIIATLRDLRFLVAARCSPSSPRVDLV